MILSKAIKKVKNEVHLEIAAGSLIAYGVFPQTNEGIQKAKETAASKDTWLAPSDLPEYYDGIDNDLIIGNETDGIRAIRKHLKEFYGISSAKTEGYVDTKSLRPVTPAGIEIQWFLIDQVGPTTWKRLKAQLTGDGYFSEVNLSEKDADELIANIKKSGEFPSLKDQSGIHNEVYQNWLVDTYLPNYAQTQVYDPGDKFVDDGKEFADKIVDDLDVALEETSDEIMDAIDAIIAEDKRKFEEFKSKVSRTVNHPELFPELQHIRPRYMWGQNGLYDLEFKSDIDRAIYFAGKLGSNSKDSDDKVAVREWLFLVTGLNVRDDYDEIKKYRGEILALILQLVKLNPNEREIIVPPVYDGYYQDPDEDEEDEEEEYEEDFDEEEDDDLYGDNLDNLLDSLKDEEEESASDVLDQAETAAEVLEEAEQAESDVDESALDDLPDDLRESLLEHINKKRAEKSKSSNVTNAKIMRFLTSSMMKIHGQLDAIDNSIREQNILIQSSIDISIANLQSIAAQDRIFSEKLENILSAITNQTQLRKSLADKAEDIAAESALENARRTTKTFGYDTKDDDPGKGSGGSGVKSLVSRLARRLFSKLWKKYVPAGLRAKIRLGRMRLKGIRPGSLTRVLPKTQQVKPVTQAVAKGWEHIALPGVRKAAEKAAPEVAPTIVGAASKKTPTLLGKLGTKASSRILKAIPFLGAAISIADAINQFNEGDVTGGMLALGSAIPVAGWGFLAVDIARDVVGEDKFDKEFFGDSEREKHKAKYGDNVPHIPNIKESGGEVKPGWAELHGTEMIVDEEYLQNNNPMNEVAGQIISATSGFLNAMGPAAGPIATSIKQIISPLNKIFDIPVPMVNVKGGGSMPTTIGNKLESLKKKGDGSDSLEGLSREEQDLINSTPESFAEKLLRMIDPEDNFGKLLRNIVRSVRDPFSPLEDYDSSGIFGDLKGNIVNPMEQGELQDYPGAKFGAPRKNGRKHEGRDIIGPPGMKFVAAMPGKVTEIFEVADIRDGGISYGITVQHANNMKTRYLHVTPSVKQGDEVKAGQKLGVITKQDNISSAPHLHFELWVSGRPVDPDNPNSSILKKAYKISDIQAGKVAGLSLDPGGKTPLETYSVSSTPLSGQEITQNFGMQTGQEKMFTSGGKQYKAHKTAKGFEFFDGMTRLNTSGGSNNQIVRDFMESQGIQFERVDNDNPADDFMRRNNIRPAPVTKPRFETINVKNTSLDKTHVIINNQSTAPAPIEGVAFKRYGENSWYTEVEVDKELKKIIYSRLAK